MKNKHEELEIRNIMQGLEEFATFMSYQGNTQGLRILSVETVEQDRQRQVQHKAEVLKFEKKKHHADNNQHIHRSLAFKEANLQ